MTIHVQTLGLFLGYLTKLAEIELKKDTKMNMITHSSEIRGLCLIKWPSEMLHVTSFIAEFIPQLPAVKSVHHLQIDQQGI